MRRIATFRNGADYKHIEVGDGGYPVYGSGGEFRRASDYLYDGVSVLFGRKGTIGKPLLVSGRFWTVDTMFFTELSPEVEPRYLHYYATTMPFDYYSTSTALPSIAQTDLGGHRMPLPPLDVQRAIADFLDRETARIDTLIAEQQKLIHLLQERRQAAIADCVMDGSLIDPSVPSNRETCWRRGEIKHLADVTLGKMLQSSASEGDVLADYMRAANVQPDGVLKLEPKQMWFRPGELDVLDLRRGDVVVVEGGVGGFGRAAYLDHDLEGWGFQNSINRLRPRGGTDGRFIAYYLIALRTAGFIERYCNVVSMPHLTAEKLAAIPIPIPPFDEQRRIADYLDEQTAKIDTLIEESERFIELARERRAALITAAVSGQIDVRKAA
jgi:type I restriction enzyme S subunit